MLHNPRVIIVVTKDWYFLSHRVPLAQTLRSAGMQVCVAAHDTGRAAEIRALGFEFLDIPFDRKSINPLKEITCIRELARLYRRKQPDVVHHIAIKCALYGGLAAYLAKVPRSVNTITGLGYLFSNSGVLPAVLRMIVWPFFCFLGRLKNNFFIFFNHEDRDTFIQRRFTSLERSTVIPGSGVDLDRFPLSLEPAGAPVLLCACRLLADKGIGELIAAARILRRNKREFRLVIAGQPDTSNRSAIPQSQIDAWISEGIAEFPGFVSDMPELLSRCHIAVLPSYYAEGIPLFLIEAAAASRPAITCDLPGCRDIVKDGETGLLVPPRDVEALAQALLLLLDDVDKRRRMGRLARANCEVIYASETIGRLTIEFYRSILDPQVASTLKFESDSTQNAKCL